MPAGPIRASAEANVERSWLTSRGRSSGRTAPRCVVKIAGESPLVDHVVAGFQLLARAGALRARFEVERPGVTAGFDVQMVTAVIEGRPVVYDMNDLGWLPIEGQRDRIEAAHLWFKRSYEEPDDDWRPYAAKLRPWGLYFAVRLPGRVSRRREPPVILQKQARRVLRDLVRRERFPPLATFEGQPQWEQRPRVTFTPRLWDPEGEPFEQVDAAEWLDDAVRAERRALNAVRVGCVTELRARLGDAYVGGLMPTPYSLANHPDEVSVLDTAQPRYLELLRSIQVGVSTAGLNRSNPWKLGEYVAAAMAVLSERLGYEAPGFEEGRNYFAFDTAEECGDLAERLVADPDATYAMAEANHRLYVEAVRPDRAVARSIEAALA